MVEETSTNVVEGATEPSGRNAMFCGWKYHHYFVVVEKNKKNLFMLNLFMILTYISNNIMIMYIQQVICNIIYYWLLIKGVNVTAMHYIDVAVMNNK